MIISQSRRFVFVHVHKTAGEAVTLALLPYLGRGDLVLGTTICGKLRDIHHRRARGISKHSSALALRAYLGAEVWEGCFSFAFVRHPFDRIQSFYAYLGMMVDRRQGPGLRNLLYAMPFFERGDPLRWPAIQAYLATGGFSEFIRHPAFLADPGARSQHAMLADGDGRVLVDFVGRFERLAADFARVTARLGLPEVPLPKHNASSRRRMARCCSRRRIASSRPSSTPRTSRPSASRWTRPASGALARRQELRPMAAAWRSSARRLRGGRLQVRHHQPLSHASSSPRAPGPASIARSCTTSPRPRSPSGSPRRGTRRWRGSSCATRRRISPSSRTCRPATASVVDVSPSYLQNPNVPARIAGFAPAARIVILLRDPVAKVFSQYVHLWSSGSETLAFAEAFAASAERRAAGYSPMWDYEAGGYYADAVARYLERFGRDRVRVEIFEELFGADPAAARGLEAFLGVAFAERPAAADQSAAAGSNPASGGRFSATTRRSPGSSG